MGWETPNGIKLENIIMEAIIGRKLKKNEKVMFINGDYNDCRSENLKLVTLNILK